MKEISLRERSFLETMGSLRSLYRGLTLVLILVLTFQYFYFYPPQIHWPTTNRIWTERPTGGFEQKQSILGIKPPESLFYIQKDPGQSSTASPEFSEGISQENELFLLYNKTLPESGNKKTAKRLVEKNNNNSSHNSPIQNPGQLQCPEFSPKLVGFVKVKLESPSLDQISALNPQLALGGHFSPKECKARDRVAIIVPFRDREEHLRVFLYNIHPFLQRQLIEYNLFVIEQGGRGEEEFNRAMLFNVGFREAEKVSGFTFDCFIFHDVDLIPENDRNLYNCPTHPRHMSVAVDKMKYQLPYKTIFGGIAAMRKADFEKVNGFSNSFWGWGAEDDDMSNRIAFNGLFISRPSPGVARYKMLKHKQQKLNNNRYRILHKGKSRFGSDGLSNLNYTVEQIVLEKLYTLLKVNLPKLIDT